MSVPEKCGVARIRQVFGLSYVVECNRVVGHEGDHAHVDGGGYIEWSDTSGLGVERRA